MSLDIFTWIPTYGAKLGVTPTLLSASYGDGYSQDMPAGINSNPEVWTLSFTLTPDEGDRCMDFFNRQGGYLRFWWTPPRYVNASKFKTTGEYAKTETNAGYVTVTATFMQCFDPDTDTE